MGEKRTLTIYLFLITLFLAIMLVFANFIAPDQTRNIITIRIVLFSAMCFVGIFTLLSFIGKWG